jgi:hypothetical protein
MFVEVRLRCNRPLAHTLIAAQSALLYSTQSDPRPHGKLTSTRNEKECRWPENLRAIEREGAKSCATPLLATQLKIRLQSAPWFVTG